MILEAPEGLYSILSLGQSMSQPFYQNQVEVEEETGVRKNVLG
jgi:hypothetical protein